MKHHRIAALLLIISFMAAWSAGCRQPAAPNIQHITANEAKVLIQKNDGNPEFVILDIRTPKEFRQGHIPGAVMLDYYSRDFAGGLQRLDKSRTYLIYCRTGNRSSRTLKMLQKMDFKMIYHLKQGIVDWHAHKLPIKKSSQ